MAKIKTMFAAVFASCILFVGAAQAQVMWIDYSWKVEPQNEKKFVSAVEKFTQSETFATFPGKMWFVVHTANGSNPTTHSFAVVYDKVEDFDATARDLANSEDFDRFRKALNAAAEPLDEVVYSHVKGYGAHPKEALTYQVSLMSVANPVGYLGAVDKLMQNNVMSSLPGGFDIWQVVAGGPPGASHIVVFANNSFAEGMNFNRESASDPAFVRDFSALAKYRTLLGTSWTTSPVKFGSSDLSSMR